ncbi:MAG: tetratricopeptide repeat protein [Desulfobacterales bacterium]|nr:tetratricopeptide repeat protein [Desulfobacterales bacterium]
MKNNNLVTRQTLFLCIAVALTIGFIGGAAFTSFKLAAPSAPGPGMPPQAGKKQMPPAPDNSAQIAARILKIEQFLKENPNDADAWANLGNQFFDSNRFADAIEAYEKSLSLKPDNAHVLTDLGVMYRRNENPQKAVEMFDKAIGVDPSLGTPRFNKGVVLMHDLENMAGAIKAWEELVTINPMAQTPGGELVAEVLERLKKNQ